MDKRKIKIQYNSNVIKSYSVYICFLIRELEKQKEKFTLFWKNIPETQKKVYKN